jgi:hypothetical protein
MPKFIDLFEKNFHKYPGAKYIIQVIVTKNAVRNSSGIPKISCEV